MAFVSAHGLTKTYRAKSGPVHALDGLDIEIEQGTVRGLLGPNGAGKTTTVKVLSTLLRPDGGQAFVAGVDVLADPAEVRRRIGASGQYAAVDERLTARENLLMVGRLYHLGSRRSRERAEELLHAFDLVEAADRPLKGFSGGMRRRVDLAGALVINPPVLFLDEPTTGLDPQARLGLWDVIRERAAEGTTVLLTTQYLEEADQLADQISVIDRGKVIAEGTADELKASVGGRRVQVTLVNESDAPRVAGILERHGRGPADVSGRGVTVQVENATLALRSALAEIDDAGIDIHEAGVRRPTLDDVFLTLTGHGAVDDDMEAAQ
ncbi:ATP-binding cassette domain-containing protein [Tessaracoccus antarcticus]|uniref:ATP-binding cassette domain-containing protein n=1 Tax=Tessaracoccus antarcticus TaxID=2479848 RepID=A0A3M0G0C2_9ACTN|nr:ATP-binding cassette domain-containing protein [Tessaracoccus antarcticus]RMB58374.1 ATP-binding cassette domain-containing protein [Tessaracoccus antarcticus]